MNRRLSALALTLAFLAAAGGALAAPPTLVSVTNPCGSLNLLLVVFSEPMEAKSTERKQNYALSVAGTNVKSISLSADGRTATITLNKDLVPGISYSLIVSDVKSAAGTTIAPNPTTSASFLPCPPLGGPDHLAISHDGSAVNCQAEPITIAVHDALHAPVAGYMGTITLSTPTNRGDWTLITGTGTLTNLSNGRATYVFNGTEGGQVVLGLKVTVPETTNINVTDGTRSESATEDPPLVFAATGFSFLAGGAASAIGSQIAGKPSNTAPGAQVLELQAIDTSTTTGACQGSLVGSLSVEFALECLDPDTCGTVQAGVSGNGGASYTAIARNDAGAVTAWTSVAGIDFGSSATSRAPLVIRYADAGQVRLHARYNIPRPNGTPSGNYISGASNAFVVRPFAFFIDVTGAPAAIDAAGPVFRAAGQSFPAILKPVVWESGDDPLNYLTLTGNAVTRQFSKHGPSVMVNLARVLQAPALGAAGTLTGGGAVHTFTDGTGGGEKNVTLAWDEVGILTLTANVASYLGGAAIPGQRINLGRFTPHHFEVTVLPGCGTFNYSGQPFDHPATAPLTGVTATAHAAGHTITTNYHGPYGFAKTVTFSNAGSVANFTNQTLPGADFTLGLGNDRDIAYTFPVKETSPVTLTLRGVDTDLVSSSGYTEETALIRSGRLTAQNAFGPELLPLSVPLRLEYYLDGVTGWTLNGADTCTSLAPGSELLLYNGLAPKAGRLVGNTTIPVAGALTTTASALPFAGGIGSLSLSAPGDGGSGTVDLEILVPAWLRADLDGIDHGLLGPGGHCNPGLAAAAPGFIAGCAADGLLDDDAPTVRATFGIFRGNPKMIYLRERVQ